jgi:hypothetical protein
LQSATFFHGVLSSRCPLGHNGGSAVTACCAGKLTRIQKLKKRERAMFGIGSAEMIILGLICAVPAIAGIIGIGVLIWYGMQKNKNSSSQENEQ